MIIIKALVFAIGFIVFGFSSLMAFHTFEEGRGLDWFTFFSGVSGFFLYFLINFNDIWA